MTDNLDYISSYCGVDIFLLGPKLTPMVDGMTGEAEMRMDQRWRVAIYGDILSSEHAKARVLIHIDTLVKDFHALRSGHDPNFFLARSRCRRYETRIVLSPARLWPPPQEYQVDRVIHRDCYLLPAPVLADVPLLPPESNSP